MEREREERKKKKTTPKEFIAPEKVLNIFDINFTCTTIFKRKSRVF